MKDSHPYLGRPRGDDRSSVRSTPAVTRGLNREESAETVVAEDARVWGSWRRVERTPALRNGGKEDMRGKQKTMDSYLLDDRIRSEDTAGAPSMSEMDTAEGDTYSDLLELVLDDENIGKALKQVVGNRGAPGIDGMSVFELQEWLPANIDALKETVRAGKYKPRPVRRVEIPKPDGGVRTLGVPTAIDRLLQQAVSQVLTPIYEPTFSDSSFGFRPSRSAQDAILRARGYMDEGYHYAVDIDLSKFFDTLNQDILMTVVRQTVRDRRLTDLIKRFIKAGAVLPDGLRVSTDEGTPQEGPLSPLLANIYLDRFDKLMESRGLRFCRYADDIVVFVRSPRAAERVMDSCVRFLEGKDMKLKVNRDKSSHGPKGREGGNHPPSQVHQEVQGYSQKDNKTQQGAESRPDSGRAPHLHAWLDRILRTSRTASDREARQVGSQKGQTVHPQTMEEEVHEIQEPLWPLSREISVPRRNPFQILEIPVLEGC